MERILLKSKIHRAVITDLSVDYIGSITIDPLLMKAADLVEYEKVLIANIANGNRFETYVITGRENSGDICINGAAAHLCKKGDLIIIMAFAPFKSYKNHKPSVVFVDAQNKAKTLDNSSDK